MSRTRRPVRGVVIIPEDLGWAEWPDRAAEAGLNTIALHPTPGAVSDFIRTEPGQRFLKRCAALGVDVEYELHAMGELLPRRLFDDDASMFRMDEEGNRTPDANLCVQSEKALDAVARNAVDIARALTPTTGRHFFWGDDGKPACRCPGCRDLSPSDQALVVENRIVAALRAEVDPQATLAHLAYLETLDAPAAVTPEPGVFLEFAPIRRRFDRAVSDADVPENARHLALLDANLAVFGAHNVQILEYWLDSSLFSDWRRPAVRVPWDGTVVAEDLRAYSARGIRNVTTFAVYLDDDYVNRFGEPPVGEYGALLSTLGAK